jgi:hypothetical protein
MSHQVFQDTFMAVMVFHGLYKKNHPKCDDVSVERETWGTTAQITSRLHPTLEEFTLW